MQRVQGYQQGLIQLTILRKAEQACFPPRCQPHSPIFYDGFGASLPSGNVNAVVRGAFKVSNWPLLRKRDRHRV